MQNRRGFLKLLGLGAAAVAVEPVRKLWFVGSNAPVGSRIERVEPQWRPAQTHRDAKRAMWLDLERADYPMFARIEHGVSPNNISPDTLNEFGKWGAMSPAAIHAKSPIMRQLFEAAEEDARRDGALEQQRWLASHVRAVAIDTWAPGPWVRLVREMDV